MKIIAVCDKDKHGCKECCFNYLNVADSSCDVEARNARTTTGVDCVYEWSHYEEVEE